MSTITIRQESPGQPDVIALIEALDAYQQPLYPAESHHGVPIDALDSEDVVFAVARDGHGQAAACGAVLITPQYGEFKRMFTADAFRRRGIAARVAAFLETSAAQRGCSVLQLETGYLQPEAIALYERLGFVRCGPFGDYTEDPNSVFMRKDLARPSQP